MLQYRADGLQRRLAHILETNDQYRFPHARIGCQQTIEIGVHHVPAGRPAANLVATRPGVENLPNAFAVAEVHRLAIEPEFIMTRSAHECPSPRIPPLAGGKPS